MAADEGLNGLWRKVRHILPKNVAKHRSNLRCRGPQVDELIEHYANLEAGSTTTYEDLLARCIQRQHEAQHDLPLTLSLNDLPTRVEIEQICRLAKRGRAPGLDRVSAEHLQHMMTFPLGHHLSFALQNVDCSCRTDPVQGRLHLFDSKEARSINSLPNARHHAIGYPW